MDTLSSRLRRALNGPPKLRQADLARACGVRPPSVSDWVSGRTVNLEGKNLLAAARFLGVRPEWLSTGLGPMRPKDSAPDPIRQIPVLSWQGVVTGEKVAISWQPAHPDTPASAYCLCVQTDAMTGNGRRTFPPGSLVYVDPMRSATTGSVVIFADQDSPEASMRVMACDCGRQYLIPLNHQYPTIPVSESTKILGVVTAVYIADKCE